MCLQDLTGIKSLRWKAVSPSPGARMDAEQILTKTRMKFSKWRKLKKTDRIPSELVPCCSCCGGPVTVNMANSNAFFQTEQFQKKMQDYQNFIKKYHGKRLAILELGVGWRNRMIKEPFMSLAASEPEAVYITFNKGEVYIPSEIAGKSIGVDGDIGEALKEICLARENL